MVCMCVFKIWHTIPCKIIVNCNSQAHLTISETLSNCILQFPDHVNFLAVDAALTCIQAGGVVVK